MDSNTETRISLILRQIRPLAKASREAGKGEDAEVTMEAEAAFVSALVRAWDEIERVWDSENCPNSNPARGFPCERSRAHDGLHSYMSDTGVQDFW